MPQLRSNVVVFLEALGVTGADSDPLLDFALSTVTWRIQNLTNLILIPEGLHPLAVQMAVGEYLKWRKSNGSLEGFDLDAAIKQIQEGDTNIAFALGAGSQTPEERLDALIDYLINGRQQEIYCYRRLKW